MATEVTKYNYPTTQFFIAVWVSFHHISVCSVFKNMVVRVCTWTPPFHRHVSLSLKWLMGLHTVWIHCEPELNQTTFPMQSRSGMGRQALHHCKLLLPVVAEDWRRATSWWTSLTAKMRVSMLCRVVPSNGWDVYQCELLRSEKVNRKSQKKNISSTLHCQHKDI